MFIKQGWGNSYKYLSKTKNILKSEFKTSMIRKFQFQITQNTDEKENIDDSPVFFNNVLLLEKAYGQFRADSKKIFFNIEKC